MYRRYIKRILDIFFSLILSIFVLILTIPIAIMIKLDDGGSIFYNAYRYGLKMKKFKMYKFRTMKENSPDIRNKDGSTYNSTNDPRVTKVGRFLRKTSLDELPQIFNVLKGDMSFVGPRPSPLGNEKLYPKEYFRKFDILPGITGYNQAIKRNSASKEEREKNDLYYVDNLSFLLDCKIVFKTISSVLKKKNINRN